MTASNGKYVVNVSTSYAQIIFCRMNGSISSNSWNNCWNQTADLKISDGNLYTLTGWGSGNKMNGYWKTTTATTAPTTTTTQATTTKATTTEATTNSSNGTFLAGTFNNWSTSANPITITYRGGSAQVALNSGYYEFKFVTVSGDNKSWAGSNDSITGTGSVKASHSAGNVKLTITEDGTYSFYYRMDTGVISVSKVQSATTATTAPTTTTAQPTTQATTTVQPTTTDSTNGFFVAGSFNGWNTSANKITSQYRGGGTEIYLNAGNYEFKFVNVNGNSKTWYGGNGTITDDGYVQYSTSAGNIKLNITEAGTYNFYIRIDLARISVSKVQSATTATTATTTVQPTTTASVNGTFLAGTFNNWSTSANPITTTYRGGDVWLYLTPGYYEFKFVTVYNDGNSKSWVGSDSTITNSGTVSYSGSAGNIKLYVTEAGTYDFYMRMDMNRITVSKSS
jgi:hypothetical protein